MSLGRTEGMSAESTSLKEVHVMNLERHQADKLALTNPVSIGNVANIYRACLKSSGRLNSENRRIYELTNK